MQTLILNHNWIETNYTLILEWANNICKGDDLADELAHYAIEKLMTHPRYDELVEKDLADPDYGHMRAFILAIMRNSWLGSKSHFRRHHALHRADVGTRKETLTDDKFNKIVNAQEDTEYDYEKDLLWEATESILQEMELEIEEAQWFRARLLRMYLEIGNYSKIARETDIPRMTVTKAVAEARTYILQELKNRGII